MVCLSETEGTVDDVDLLQRVDTVVRPVESYIDAHAPVKP